MCWRKPEPCKFSTRSERASCGGGRGRGAVTARSPSGSPAPIAESAGMRHGFPSDDEIRALLERRIDVSRRAVGGAIGIVDAAGVRTIAYGRPSKDDTRPVTADTLFELGCVTKVLTG